MKYTVEIIETLRREVEVNAPDEDKALNAVKDLYRDQEIVLDASDCIGSDIQIYKPIKP